MFAIFDQGRPPPCPTPFNLAAHVLGRAAEFQEKIALSILHSDKTEDWSYAQLEQAVLGVACGLQKIGLKPGNKVLIRLGNSVDFPVAYLGCIAAGIIPIPTSAQLSEPEVAAILSDLSPEMILLGPGIACPACAKTLSLEAFRQFYTLCHTGDMVAYEVGDPNRLAYIIYTSGTSGKPRAVAHAHRAIWARQMMIKGWYDLRANDRLLHAGAFNWTYTLGTGLMDPWTMGATALIPGNKIELPELPGLLAKHRASIFAAAPGVYRKMLNNKIGFDVPGLRHGLSAGEKLPMAVRAAWTKATNTPIYEAYGMSECSTFISSCPAHPAQGGALGCPQTGRQLAIVDENGPVVWGDEGTIAIHRSDPGLMLGYLNEPEETALRMQGDWFLTGDQGKMAANGQVTYLGRADDMMNAGGYRVSPLEVEAALADMPGVDGIGVIDVAVKKDLRVIAAFYTGPKALDDAALQRYAKDKLARYKQPRIYVHLPSLPTGANGKLLRRALRIEFEAQNDQT